MRKEKLGAGNRLLKKDLRQDGLAELGIESEQNSTGNVQKELTDSLPAGNVAGSGHDWGGDSPGLTQLPSQETATW